MRRAARLVVGLLVAALVLLGAFLGLRQAAVHRAEQALNARELRWQARRDGLLAAGWAGLEGPGIRAEALEVQLLPRPTAVLRDVQVELSQVDRGGGQGGTADEAGGQALPLAVRIEGLDLLWKGELLAEDLAGPLLPEVRLVGQGVEVRREQGRWAARVDRALSLGPLEATARAVLREEEAGLHVVLDAPDAVLDHPGLASGPLPPAPLHVELHRGASGQLQGEVRLGSIQAAFSGRVELSPLAFDLHLSADQVPLTDVIALFGPHLPEARTARCQGTLGLSLDLKGSSLRREDLQWKAWPRAEGLACEGLLVDVDGLKAGAVTWKARGPDGAPRVKHTGPGEFLWTPWTEGRPVAEAMMASEDIAFPSHPGFDLGAIQEALDEAAAGDPRPRGGSTMTQQLAKNLFLDGERTLARKLRELLYALDLEASLDKRHILQLYINIVELGPDLHGVGPAAHAYFAKRPGGLTDKEAAFLAALLPSPARGYARAMEGHFPEQRMEEILDNMVRAGMRTPEQRAAARRQRLVVLPPLTTGAPERAR